MGGRSGAGERGGTDGAQLTPSQRRLQHVGGVHGALGGAGANQGVQLVDKENDLTFGFGNFLQNRLEAVLKFTAVFRSGHQRG